MTPPVRDVPTPPWSNERKQNADVLEVTQLGAIAVDAKNANESTFKDIEVGKYRVIIFGPEVIMQSSGYCEKLWDKPSFTRKILYMVFNEAHCITQWAAFRGDYRFLGTICRLISDTFPFLLPLVTMPMPIIRDVTDTMLLWTGRTSHILRSNDRLEISIAVHQMQHSAASMKDLDFLIPEDFNGNLVKFLLFTQSIKEAEAIARYLRARLPLALHSKIHYFHSVMIQQYRADECALYKDNQTYGLCITDTFGMAFITELPSDVDSQEEPPADMEVDELVLDGTSGVDDPMEGGSTTMMVIVDNPGLGAAAEPAELDAMEVEEPHNEGDEHGQQQEVIGRISDEEHRMLYLVWDAEFRSVGKSEYGVPDGSAAQEDFGEAISNAPENLLRCPQFTGITRVWSCRS
ncbi:hypothetical protein BN946_scf185042.g30 [Trametes cinnabarina]|uniref:DNA 3'-5' helicase n=1 Tax=Pycnoporus cinnabarinus TaxID=5643 RepID=A0A060S9R0_PYCCI|nr:hypothetical protein BN946_scf185042.g30 [Trametes cinnabarina]